MSQKALTIFTPPAEPGHIAASDDAQMYRAVFGGSGITPADNMLAVSIQDNNTVRLSSGLYSNHGYLLCVPSGDTLDLTITSGTTGYYRRDLVIARFTRGGGSTADTHVFTVLAGTPATTLETAVRPTLTQSDISVTGGVREEALYEVLVSGTIINSTTRIAGYVGAFYR